MELIQQVAWQMVPDTGNKIVVTSLREVAAGYVKIDNQTYSRDVEKSYEDVEYAGTTAADDAAIPLRTIEGGEKVIEEDDLLVPQEISSTEALIDTDIPARSL